MPTTKPRMYKRLLCIALSVVMAFTIAMPQASAFADEGQTVQAEGAQSTLGAETPGSVPLLSLGSDGAQDGSPASVQEQAATSSGMGVLSFDVQDTTVYYDGTYEGTGGGHRGDVAVRVTIEDGKIAKVEEVAQSETASYWERAKALFERIVEQQTYNVDGVSGATNSSNGIKQATMLALRKAQTPPAGPFSAGTGTQTDPYIVSTADGLQKLATSVDEGESYAGTFIELGADLDLSGIANWNPIGTEVGNAAAATATIFAGSFDGAGHTISNLTIAGTFADNAVHNVGLFSTLQNTAKVVNLNLEGVNIDAKGDNVVCAGAIAGDTVSGTATTHAVIDGCSAAGTVSVDTSGAFLAFAGGVVGRMNAWSTVANSWTDVATTAISRGGNNSGYAGGIVGMAGNNTGIVNSATFGDTTGSSPASTNFGGMAGGIGGMLTSKMYNTYALGNATIGNAGNSYTWVGALAGEFAMAGMLNSGTAYPDTGTFRAFGYYPADVVLTEQVWAGGTPTNNTVAPQGCGTGVSYDQVFTGEALARATFATEDFATTLDNNIRASLDLAAAYTLGITELNTWVVKDGRVLPIGSAWVETEVDASIFDSGSGTQEDPYKIRTEEQLRAFALSLTSVIDYAGTFVEVIADIDVSSAPWVPVGHSEYAFNGTFDGGGHTISGMYMGAEAEPAAIESGAVFVGFFSVLAQDAVVKNVNLKDVYFNVAYPATIRVGGIAAYMQGSTGSTREGAQIESCSVTGKIDVTADDGNVFAAGIAGYQYKGTITNSWTDVDINVVTKGSALAEGGGLVALNNRGLVANCYTLGSIYGSGNRENGNEGMASISSLVGVNGGDVANCYGAGGHTSAELSVYVGAVTGWVTGVGKSYNSFYNGDAPMQVGTQTVSPVESIGTKVPSGVSDEGDVYTGGVVDALAPYTAASYAGIADALNANFAAFPVELGQYGLAGAVLKSWVYTDGLVTFGTDLNETTYVQPEAEIVPVVEPTLRDGVWYGRDADKASVAKIVVEGEEIVSTEVVEGPAEGDAYDAALAKAKEKAVYGDTSDYYPFEPSMFAGGTGTADDPYQVATEEQLRYIAQRLNADNLWEGVSFVQTADIAVSADEWLPIGWGILAEINNRATQYCAYPFLGNYDGGDFSVTGVTIGVDGAPTQDPRMQYVAGFFGFTSGEAAGNALPAEGERVTKISNVHLKDVDVNVATRYQNYVGGLAGNLQNGFYVDNCSVDGAVRATTEETTARAGGLVGNALRGLVTNSWTDVAVYAYDEAMAAYAGGLYALDNRTTTVNCYTLGTTTCGAGNNNRVNVGGLVGQAGGYYYNCYTHGNVVAENTTTFAGLANGNFAGIGVAKDVYFNTDAGLTIAGTQTDPVANGRVVTEEEERLGFEGKTAAEMADRAFAALLTNNIGDVPATMERFAEIIAGGTLASVLYYQGDGSDLLPWTVEGDHAVFGEEDLGELEVVHVGDPLWVAGQSADIVAQATNLAEGEKVVKWFWEYSKNGRNWTKTGAKSFSDDAGSTLYVPECTKARKAPMAWRVTATTSLGRTATTAGQSLTELKKLEVVKSGAATWAEGADAWVAAKVEGLAPGEKVKSWQWYYSKDDTNWKKTGAASEIDEADATITLSGFACTAARRAPMAWCVKVTTEMADGTTRTATSAGISLE